MTLKDIFFIYESKIYSNFEKRTLIRRMFKSLETENNHELPYTLAIFKNMKNACE